MSGEIETESLRKCIELSTVTDTSAVKVIATAKILKLQLQYVIILHQ